MEGSAMAFSKIRPRGKNINYTGKRFGTLTIIGWAKMKTRPDGRSYSIWYYKCDCGRSGTVPIWRLSNKRDPIKSCGCRKFKDKHGNCRLSPEESSYKSIINAYKQSAKARGLRWDLPYDVVLKLILSPCKYCGIPPFAKYNRYLTKDGHNRRDHKKTITDWSSAAWVTINGIDRMHNGRGYVLGNVVPCCEPCNRAKWDLPYETWMEWIKRVVRHNS